MFEESQQSVVDSPENSANTQQPTATPVPESAPHAEASAPVGSAATHEELAANPSQSSAQPTQDANAIATNSLGAEPVSTAAVTTVDARMAIHKGLTDGLRKMGKLPEWLGHEIEKLVDSIHAEVSKL